MRGGGRCRIVPHQVCLTGCRILEKCSEPGENDEVQYRSGNMCRFNRGDNWGRSIRWAVERDNHRRVIAVTVTDGRVVGRIAGLDGYMGKPDGGGKATSDQANTGS